jgi:hypothetical protein
MAKDKLPPLSQASMDAASKMDAQEYKSMKKMKPAPKPKAKAPVVKKAKGGKVTKPKC